MRALTESQPVTGSLECSAALFALLLASLSPDSQAQGVQRCESPDHKVTYSNTSCPEGTKAVRSVNTSPPVAVDNQKAAKDRARRDAAEVREIDKAKAKESTQAERVAADQKKTEEKDRQRCEQARRDLDQARTTRADLMGQEAASIEQMQKADKELSRREGEVTKACPAG
jgi:flagellum-specific peptidoglycan hydrolase FlgJ